MYLFIIPKYLSLVLESNVNTECEGTCLGIPPAVAHRFFRVASVGYAAPCAEIVATEVETALGQVGFCYELLGQRITDLDVSQ